MTDHRTTDPLIDDPLGREIERALAVEPSAEFLARVRTQVAALPAPNRGPWRLRWAFLTVGAAVTAGVVAMVLLDVPSIGDRQRQPEAQARQVAPESRSPRAASVEPPERVASHLAVAPAGTRERSPGRPTPARAENLTGSAVAGVGAFPLPEVLLPVGETRAWQEYLSMFRDGDFERPLPKLILSRVEGEAPPEIVIPPLTPEPDEPIQGEVE